MTLQNTIKLFTIAGLISLSATGFAHSADATFKDWSVICAEDGYCEASTEDTKQAAGALRVGRTTGDRTRWEISVETKPSDNASERPTLLRMASFVV